MAIKSILDNVDDLSADLQALYVEKDGKFYLDLDEDIKSHPRTVALKNALDRVREEKTALQTKVTTLETKSKDLPDDFNLDEWLRLKALDVDPNDPEASKRRKDKEDERLAATKRGFEQQIVALNTKITSLEADANARVEKERALRAGDRAKIELEEAMTKSNIDPKFREAVAALHNGRVKSVFDDDSGELSFHVETDLGPTRVTDYLENWSKSDAGKHYVSVPTGPSGDPRQRGNVGDNPFSANQWNKTAQAALRNDLVRGNRLAQAAGFKDLAEGLGATRAIQKAS